MAQVEQYLTDHLHASKERSLDDPSHPLNSAVPSRPGPELDIKYHGLPEPPHYIPPQSHENHDSAETQDISVATRSVEEDQTTLDHVPEPIKSSEAEKELDHHDAEEVTSHPINEVEKVPDHDNVEEATSHVTSAVDKAPDHEEKEFSPHSTSEVVKDSVPPPVSKDISMPEKSEPDHVTQLAESTEKPSMEPEPTREAVDHPTTLKEEPSPVKEATETEESKAVPEPVLAEEVSPVEEAPIIAESEPLTNGISHEEETLKEEEVVQSEPKGIISQPLVNQNQSATQTESAVSTHDWTDLTRPEVQFALCLFAVPWTSLLITSRTLNQICYMIFDWQLVQPVTGLLLSVLAPSILYTSLIAVFISLLTQSSTNA